ncbi:response regulator [Dickeya ananatis]
MAFFIESFIRKHPEFLLLGSADTLADARIAIAAQKPDLVMLDNYLPDGTGIDMMKHLRATQPEVDVIFITAANDIETIKAAIRHGASDYLVKPFILERLEEALKKLPDVQQKSRPEIAPATRRDRPGHTSEHSTSCACRVYLPKRYRRVDA